MRGEKKEQNKETQSMYSQEKDSLLVWDKRMGVEPMQIKPLLPKYSIESSERAEVIMRDYW